MKYTVSDTPLWQSTNPKQEPELTVQEMFEQLNRQLDRIEQLILLNKENK
jgi:hypothetical protein